MTVLRANFTNLMQAGLDRVLWKPWEDSPPDSIINAVFNVDTHDSQFVKEMMIKGHGLMNEKPEGEPYGASDPSEAWWTKLEHIPFGIMSTITHEAQSDERFGQIKKFPDSMRESAEATMNYHASRVLSLGFSALPNGQTSSRATDEYLFDSAHILKNGDTGANRPTVDAALTATTLWAAVDAFYEMTNEAGLPWVKPPKTLILPHQLQRKGIELLASPQFPEDANNAINALRKAHDIQPVVWPYWLGSVDPDAWYLSAAKENHQVKFIWREKYRTSMDVEKTTENLLYFLYMRFSCGWMDWKGIYGSAGA